MYGGKVFKLFTVLSVGAIITLGFDLKVQRYAGFDILYGMSLNSNCDLPTILVTAECRCRIRCLNDPSCVVYGGQVEPSGLIKCYTAKKEHLPGLTSTEEENSFYAFKFAYFPEYKMERDGYLYWLSPSATSFLNGKEICEGKGLTLGRYKTPLQLDILIEYRGKAPAAPNSYMWTDLLKVDGVPTWGDGEWHNTTELGSTSPAVQDQPQDDADSFILVGAQFHDHIRSLSAWVLCQVDPSKYLL